MHVVHNVELEQLRHPAIELLQAVHVLGLEAYIVVGHTQLPLDRTKVVEHKLQIVADEQSAQ